MKTRHISLTFLAVIVTAVLWISCREQVSDSAQNPVASDYEKAIVDIHEDVTAEPISNADSVMQGVTPQVAKVLTPDVVSRLNGQDTTETVLLEVPGASVTVKGHQIGLHGKTFTARALSEEELHPLGGMCVNVTGGSGKGYRMLPSGEHFNPPAELRVSYNDSLIPLGYKPEDIFTSYYDESTHQWTRLHRVDIDTVNHEIVSLTTHFTDFVNEVLQAPEMPEAQAFVPTMMSDIEPPSPLDGLTVIQPPTANNNGTAEVTYPIAIPSGRGGMEPRLALSYSSQRGNGWLGVGWDITVPSITVETRWGVPRYDNGLESEVYLLEGEQLVTRDGQGQERPMPHRTNHWTPRMTGDVQFYPRAGESHDSIVRHGDNPSNYWWSVTHTNGVTDIYGARNGSLDESCVLQGFSVSNLTVNAYTFAIAEWKLSESIDQYGNKVRYYYDTISDNTGKQIYLSSINYTGHGDEEGVFDIVFERKESREDIENSGRYGFLTSTAKTLCNIDIFYRGDSTDVPRKAYYFYTECGRSSRHKTRLTDVVCVASKQILEQEHCNSSINRLFLRGKGDAMRYHFDYHDMPDAAHMFGRKVTFNNLPNDRIGSGFSLSSAISGATALGASKGKSWNVGGTATAGLGFVVCLTTVSLGGNYNYSQSSSEGLLTLADIDGDGKADKVFKQGNTVYYRRRIGLDNTVAFSNTKIPISGLSDILKESSNTDTWGVQASAGLTANGGQSYTNSTTNSYLADINGDGLMDAIGDIGPLFNTTTDSDHPTFSSLYTLFPDDIPDDDSEIVISVPSTDHCGEGGIIYDGEIDPDLTCVSLDSTLYGDKFDSIMIYDSNYYTCPRSIYRGGVDAVKVWMAPTSGRIKLTDSIQLIEDSSVSRQQCRFVDGVRCKVEKHSNVIMANGNLQSSAQNIYTKTIEANDYSVNCETRTFKISAGDILMFRLQSIDDANYDNIRWRHHIEYVSPGNGNGNGNNVSNTEIYDSYDDYVMTGKSYILTPTRGFVTLRDTVSYGGQGNMRYICRRQRGHSVLDSLVQQFSTDAQIINTTFSVDSNDTIYVLIEPVENQSVNWGALDYHPHLIFVGNIANATPVRYDTLYYYPFVQLPLPQVVVPPLNPGNGNGLAIGRNRRQQRPSAETLCQLFGPLYKGWGQFGYSAEDTSMDAFVNMSRLIQPFYTNFQSPGEVDTNSFYIEDQISADAPLESLIAAVESVYSPTPSNSRWREMTPNTEYGAWMCFGNTARIERGIASNSRPRHTIPVWPRSEVIEDDDDEEGEEDEYEVEEIAIYEHAVPISYGPFVTKTVRKKSESTTDNISVSLIAVGESSSSTTTATESDYLDLNGDRYPDAVGPLNVQYSKPWGGIGRKQAVFIGDNLSKTSANSSGVTIGGSYPAIGKQPSQSPKTAKSTLNSHGTLNAAASTSSDETSRLMVDVNGDGLPDIVKSSGEVRLNVGYMFLGEQDWRTGLPRKGSSTSFSGGIGGEFSISQYSISGGMGINGSFNGTDAALMDIDGDGLPDRVSKVGNGIYVYYNKGNGSWSIPDTLSYIPSIGGSRTFNENLDIGVTAGFTFWGMLKVCAGVQSSPYNRTFSIDTAQLADINGDGCPDYVTSDSETSMTVRFNQCGKTNLLRKITNFNGTTIRLGYGMTPSSFDKPQRSWTLDTVETCDNSIPSTPHTLTTFSYRNPHYDRFERTDYGFDTVIACQHIYEDGRFSPYRYTVTGYNNYNYQRRGKVTSEMIEDAEHRPFIETLYRTRVTDRLSGDEFEDYDCPPDSYVSRIAEIRRYYEGNPTPGVVTRTDKVYDRYHNIIGYTDHGDTSRTDEYYRATVTYRPSTGHNLVSLPTEIVVKDTNGRMLRHRKAEYSSIGALKKLSVYNGTSISETRFNHDGYGNIISMVLPPDEGNQSMSYWYTYDPVMHAYPTKVRNVFHYASHTEYDIYHGKPTQVTDINGNSATYEYDPMGRLKKVTAPYGDGSYSASVAFEYNPMGYDRVDISAEPLDRRMSNVAVTRTDSYNNSAIHSMVLCDGWGRTTQAHADASVVGTAMKAMTGTVEYDCLGRAVSQWSTFSRPSGESTTYVTPGDYAPRTTTTYDVLDRPLTVTQPYGLVSYSSYGFWSVADGTCFRTVSIDPMGTRTTTLTGSRNQTMKTYLPLDVVCESQYSPLGEVLKTIDPEGHVTTYSYDLAGRRISRHHPDAGLDSCVYDQAGNVVKRITQKLADAGQEITYAYDHSRLMAIHYPERPANDVYYTYGTSADTTFNQVGRVTMVEDATGWRSFKYGQLGEVTEETHTLAVINQDRPYSFTMHYAYDGFNRIKDIEYPDGELVSYSYDRGGQLYSVSSRKGFDSVSYINRIHYNAQGLRSYLEYGNGVATNYTYDSLMRLSSLYSRAEGNQTLQNISYSYDLVGNIVGISNTSNQTANGLGGFYNNTYTYDSLYRMTIAAGNGAVAQYKMEATYSPAGRMLTKGLHAESPILNISYGKSYSYHTGQPHTVREVTGGDEPYYLLWDANGNLNSYSAKDPQTLRRLCWTEENRLAAVADADFISHYVYDANGDRTIKLSAETMNMDINASGERFGRMKYYTIYPSPYIVVDHKGYTKHYYAGTERLCSRLGGGGLQDLHHYNGSDSVFRSKVDANHYTFKMDLVCAGASATVRDIDLEPLEFLQSLMADEQDIYWFHSDHLGSASWITDAGGQPIQHLQYLPYGETLLDQRNGGYHERYTFSGKEKDSETGYYYFGARYYNSDLSLWLSVDPMADKYPSLSPYNYCAWNPVKLVDPDGMELDDYFSKSGKYLGSDDASTRNVRIIDEKLWNSLDKDENGHVEHDLANSISASFSQASSQSMTESEQLSVYQHYNPTKIKIKEASVAEIKNPNPGMLTAITGAENDVAVVKYIGIKLQLNRTVNRTGNALCDNADEITSCYVHERNHIRRAIKMGYTAWIKKVNSTEGRRDIEKSAIKSQREHRSWNGCSEFFKQGIANYEKKF